MTCTPIATADLGQGLKGQVADYEEALAAAVVDRVLHAMCKCKYLQQYDFYSIVIALHDRDFNEHALEASKEWTEAPESFLAAFRLKNRELRYLIRRKCSAISDEGQIIETNARGDHISSFVLDLMVPTYGECAMQRGTETMVRMHKIMKTRLEKRDIFIHIHKGIEDKLQTLFDENVDGMLERITGFCSSIRGQVAAFIGPLAEAQKKNPEEVDKVRNLTDEARIQLSELQGALERLKRA
ncbi:MAG: hypothetical protein LQ348_006168 [Seirophora lacunosa]|nr:MAG: hypothetical protein LQ348_006168 [Seirophora lacunosa]